MKRAITKFAMWIGTGLATALPVASCENPEQGTGNGVAVTAISLDHPTLALTVGGDAVLEATIEPADATDKRLLWTSSEPSVATVSAGYIEAISVGQTTITVASRGGNASATCTVTVSQAVGQISFKWNSATVEVGGEPYTMQTTVGPESAANKNLIWETGDREIATVTPAGAVTGISAGKTTVTATAADGGGSHESWTVTVLSPPNTSGCQAGNPRWGTDLGTVTFKSDQTWKTGELLWSDVVMSSVCSARTQFLGRDSGMLQYYSDCRVGHPGFGDLFSWCGMAKSRHQLCPDGWRIPTIEDFIALDKALGGSGENRPHYSTGGAGPDIPILAKYTGTEWGGGYGGNVTWENVMSVQNTAAYYWGQSVEATNPSAYAMYLGFQTNGYIYVQQSTRKDAGMPIRCVR